MAKNFVQDGGTITLNAPAAVLSGAGVVVGKFFGVAAYDALINTPVEVTLDGVWTLPKVAGAITQGQALFWDNAVPALTTIAGALPRVGAATEPAADAAATVRVRLNGVALA